MTKIKMEKYERSKKEDKYIKDYLKDILYFYKTLSNQEMESHLINCIYVLNNPNIFGDNNDKD